MFTASASGLGAPEAEAFDPGCECAGVRVVRRVALVMGGHSISPKHELALPKRVSLPNSNLLSFVCS